MSSCGFQWKIKIEENKKEKQNGETMQIWLMTMPFGKKQADNNIKKSIV